MAVGKYGAFHTFEVAGMQLRYFRTFLEESTHYDGTIIILPGRASYIEKYEDVIRYWVEHHFAVFALDWRGQGGSTRMNSNSSIVHIDDYSSYVQDLEKWIDAVILPNAPKPIILYAVSMGALIAGIFLQKTNPSQISKAIFVVPMFGLITWPVPNAVAHLIVKTACFLNLGKFAVPFVNRTRTASPGHEKVFTHGLTLSWLNASLNAIGLFSDPMRLSKIQIPILIIKAGKDVEVDHSGYSRICSQILNCNVRTYENASHGIHHTESEIRTLLYQDCLAFIYWGIGGRS